MNDLKFVGVEDDFALMTSESGEQFRLPITQELKDAIRSKTGATLPEGLPSPREIQSELRSGLTSAQVADLHHVDVEFVDKYSAPVLAEIRYMVDLATAVVIDLDSNDHDSDDPTFGDAIADRVASQGGTIVEWTSWKEPDAQWTIQLIFDVDEVSRDARWSFDPRTQHLAAANNEALALFSADALQETGRPLRVVRRPSTEPIILQTAKNDAVDEDVQDGDFSGLEGLSADAPDSPNTFPTLASVTQLPPSQPTPTGGADSTDRLLDELAKRRGERVEPHPLFESFDDVEGFSFEPDGAPDVSGDNESQGTVTPLTSAGGPSINRGASTADESAPAQTHAAKPRSGRANMPSWDEIVFGSRGSDDE